MERDQIVTPYHPLWNEFLSRINEAVICLGTTEHARRALQSMSGVDVEGTLRAIVALGGRCDCEIVHGLRELAAS